jgi:hypothetical protein
VAGLRERRGGLAAVTHGTWEVCLSEFGKVWEVWDSEPQQVGPCTAQECMYPAPRYRPLDHDDLRLLIILYTLHLRVPRRSTHLKRSILSFVYIFI